MKFLIYSHYYAPEIGAPQIRLHSIAKELLAKGHEVRVVTTFPNYPTGKIFPQYRRGFSHYEEIDSVPIYRYWLFPVQRASLYRLLCYLSFQLTSFFPLLFQVLRFQPDYLLVESPPVFLGLSTAILRFILRVKVIFNVADLWPDFCVEMGVMREGSVMHRIGLFIENIAYSNADFVSAVIPSTKKNLLTKGVPPHKLLELRNGADLEFFRPGEICSSHETILQLSVLSKTQKIVLYAGNHGKAQNLSLALESAEVLSDRSDIAFVFIGDGSEKQMLVELAERKGLSSVHFFAPIPPRDIADAFRLCTLSLSIITISALASKLFPAMSSAKPVIYVGPGEGAELVRETGCGVALESCPPHELAEAIVSVVDAPDDAILMGERGREAIRLRFSWGELVKSWLSQLEPGFR